jgi:AraC-like DNA-binding protein
MNQLIDIFAINEEIVKSISENPTPPQRNNYEELVIITSGSPKYVLDFKSLQFPVPVMIYASPGRIHQFVPDKETKGWCIRYQSELLPQTSFHFYENYSNISFYDLSAGYCLQNIESLCKLISGVLMQAPPDMNLVKHLLTALLSTAQYARRSQDHTLGQPKNPDLVILDFFLQLLEENYKSIKPVEFYANRMYMSVRNLNRLSHLFFEQSISSIIETRRLVEARKLLTNTNMTVAEIGYSLGYIEKSYFTRVFHKKTGYTPTSFRLAMQSVFP